MADELTRDECPTIPLEKYKTEVFFRTLDNMSGELEERAQGMRTVSDLFSFLFPGRFSNLSPTQLEKNVDCLVMEFPGEFTSELYLELLSFRNFYFHIYNKPDNNSMKEIHVIDYLRCMHKVGLSDSYPQFELLLRLFLTLPTGIASAERSFSVLRRVKSYLRSTMGQQRLSDLAILSIERDIAASLDMTLITEEFAHVKARRGIRL
jgi:hypothetical protein